MSSLDFDEYNNKKYEVDITPPKIDSLVLEIIGIDNVSRVGFRYLLTKQGC